MSNRTALANKAVNKAWLKEQQLVNEGKGTRDWTPDQQRDIMERGRVYDESGKAFQGHHMKSVEKYPEYQGDPDNIQFLSKKEHTEAHHGDFHTPTNGYYNPCTGETKEFDENSLEPCLIIDLTEPVFIINNKTQSEVISEKEVEKNGSLLEEKKSSKTKKEICNTNINEVSESKGSDIGIVKHTIKNLGEIIKKHSFDVIVGIVAVGSRFICRAIEIKSLGIGDKDVAKMVSDSSDLPKRASPQKHMVSGYDRFQNGKKIHVNSYPRGGKGK